MSQLNRRRVLLGSLAAPFAARLTDRGEVGAAPRDRAVESGLYGPLPRAFIPLPYQFDTPIPSNKEILAASGGELGQLAYDMALEALSANQLCAIPVEDIRTAVRPLPIADAFNARYGTLSEHYDIVSTERQEFARSWPDATGARHVAHEGSRVMWQMECRYRRFTLRSKDHQLARSIASGPMVSVIGWSLRGGGPHKLLPVRLYAAWPSQLKKAGETIRASGIPAEWADHFVDVLCRWARGWRAPETELSSPGYMAHCMILDCVKRYHLDHGVVPVRIRLTADMAYHLWQWYRSEGYCAPLSLDDWKQQRGTIVGIPVIYDCSSFRLDP
jgi:hypothetical protein